MLWLGLHVQNCAAGRDRSQIEADKLCHGRWLGFTRNDASATDSMLMLLST